MSLVGKLKTLAKIPQVFNKKDKREQRIIDYLKSWNPKLNQDEIGNLYLINPDTPLICAHMDTVQDESEAEQIKGNHIRIIYSDVTRGRGYNKTTNIERVMTSTLQIGGDDKCGIAIAMQLYEKLGDKISLLFTVGEEYGCVGASHFKLKHKDLLEKCLYCIVPDRKNGKDLLCNKHHLYGSVEFEKDILSYLSPYGFESAQGSICDANQFKDILNCFNISVGYYEPHTPKDWISLDEFENTYNALLNLTSKYREKKPPYKFEYVPPKRWDDDYDYDDYQSGLFGGHKNDEPKVKTKGNKTNFDGVFTIDSKSSRMQVHKPMMIYSMDKNFILPVGTYDWFETSES